MHILMAADTDLEPLSTVRSVQEPERATDEDDQKPWLGLAWPVARAGNAP